ncbi:MAG: exo-alpha-sialidase [Opitutales bacterium]|nr:exo-alpha-sialidase [Opitutales bacterium]
MHKLILIFAKTLLVQLALGTLLWGVEKSIETQVLFRKAIDGYNNIRIPAICVTKAGTLLAFAEGREAGDKGDIDLILRRSEDGGKTWGGIEVIWDDKDNTCGNPCPVVDLDTGTIWLFLTWNLGSDSETAIMTGASEHPRSPWVTYSEDDGKTWANPKKLPHLRKKEWTWYATGPGNGVQLSRGQYNGRLVIPANHADRVTAKRDSKTYRSHIIYSDDHGMSWQLGAIQEPLTNESTVVELADGSVMQNMRSYHGKGNRAVALSKDGGASFAPLYLDNGLQSPVCQANIQRYSWPEESRSRILFSSPTGEKREGITVRLSYDEGETWPVSKMIHESPGAYSNMVGLPNGNVGLLVEIGESSPYETISFIMFDINWLEH